jgi:hypothetical protein
VVVVEARKRICRNLHRSHGACPVECHIVDKLMKKLEEYKNKNKPIISGDVILKLGYPQGKKIGEIIQAVSKKFTIEDPEEDKIKFIKENFPIS